MKNIKVDEQIHAEIVRRAKDEGWSIQQYVHMLLDSYLRQEQRKDGSLFPDDE